MSTFPVSPSEALATSVSFDDDSMIVDLADGRVLSVPLAWFPKLFDATPEQRAEYELWDMAEGFIGKPWMKTFRLLVCCGVVNVQEYKPNWNIGSIPDEVLYSEVGRRNAARRLTAGGVRPGAGRPRSSAPRCPCGLMTKKLAALRKHACG